MIPLQGDGVGGPGFIGIGLLALVLAIVFAYYVYTDANSRGKDNATLWALGIGILTLFTLVGGVIGLLVYIWIR